RRAHRGRRRRARGRTRPAAPPWPRTCAPRQQARRRERRRSTRASPRIVGPIFNTMIELGLRNDVYRRPLATALDRLGLREGWRCADIGAGGGDVTVALARIVGRDGRVYAVDSDPARRDEVAAAAAEAAQAQVVALTQAAEELTLPEPLDLAFCRFVLLHVHSPVVVLVRM